ncbi:UNVERIFIED_CONTAM: hypothetical protein FKN15_045391 [Acipenser sinensis]
MAASTSKASVQNLLQFMKLIGQLKEYEYQSSPEAMLVKELDQFEMILQAYEYEDQEKKPGRMQEFFDSTKGLRTI